MKVLVCDDIEERCKEVGKIVAEVGQDCQCLFEEDLTNKVTKLFETARAAIEDPSNYESRSQPPFDDVDIVILDNNLTRLKIKGELPTAESIAGYVRAFTKAPYVVSLNLNPGVDFDLDYLIGDCSTKADVAVNTPHLSIPALWNRNSAPAEDGFLPWYWPELESAPAKRREQIEFVRTHLRESVVRVLELDQTGIDLVDLLSPGARAALSPEAASDGEIAKGGPSLQEVAFRDHFVVKDRSIPSLQPERLKLAQAEQSGNPALSYVIARVVAADIDFWFRRYLVGPQEPLVDVPHLLVRLPFLLGRRTADIGEWNKSVTANTPPYGFEEEMYQRHLAGAKFQHDVWVPNPCFWWPKLKNDETLNEYFFQARSAEWADVVFCEDCSKFLEGPLAPGKGPIEFPTDLEGAWGRRYIARIDDRKYSPRSRLAI